MSNPATEARTAVRLAPLSVDLATLLGWSVAFGICSVSYYILRGLFSFTESTVGSLVGWIPGVNHFVKSKLESAERKVTHWVGQAAASSEARMGDAFHASANLTASIGHEIYGQAVATWGIAHWVYKLSASVLSGEAYQEIFHNDIVNLRAREKQLEAASRTHGRAISHADQPPIAAGVDRRTKPIATQATHTGTLEIPGIRAGARAREDALERDVAETRAGVRAAEGAIDSLWERVRHLDKVTTGVLASALVATALGRLGGGWLRCSNVGRVGRGICRMPTRLLEDLLGLLADFVVLSSICRVIPWLEAGFADVAAPLIDTLTKAGSALRCGGGLGDETLAVPALHLPAGADPTLHLP